jgi:hypothetical protein
MTALILALSLMAADARAENAALAREMSAELDADVCLMSRDCQRLALSALICADNERLANVRGRLLQAGARMPLSLVLAYQEAAQAVESAELALSVIEQTRQECGGDVARIAACLGDVPGVECDEDAIAGEVAAALRLRGVRR